MIVFTHLSYRQQVNAGRLPESSFRMPATPAANWFVLAFLAMVLVLLAFNKDTVIALYVAPVWVAIWWSGISPRALTTSGLTREPTAAGT